MLQNVHIIVFFVLEVYCQFVGSLSTLILFMWSSLIVFVGITHVYVSIIMFRHIVACKHCQALLWITKNRMNGRDRKWRASGESFCSHTVIKRDSLLQRECVYVPRSNISVTIDYNYAHFKPLLYAVSNKNCDRYSKGLKLAMLWQYKDSSCSRSSLKNCRYPFYAISIQYIWRVSVLQLNSVPRYIYNCVVTSIESIRNM